MPECSPGLLRAHEALPRGSTHRPWGSSLWVPRAQQAIWSAPPPMTLRPPHTPQWICPARYDPGRGRARLRACRLHHSPATFAPHGEGRVRNEPHGRRMVSPQAPAATATRHPFCSRPAGPGALPSCIRLVDEKGAYPTRAPQPARTPHLDGWHKNRPGITMPRRFCYLRWAANQRSADVLGRAGHVRPARRDASVAARRVSIAVEQIPSLRRADRRSCPVCRTGPSVAASA